MSLCINRVRTRRLHGFRETFCENTSGLNKVFADGKRSSRGYIAYLLFTRITLHSKTVFILLSNKTARNALWTAMGIYSIPKHI